MNTKQNESKVIHVRAATEPLARGVIETWENSLALRIPANIAKMYRLADGVEIDFFPSEPGHGFFVKPRAYPQADDQQGLRAFYLSLVAQVTSDMKDQQEEDAVWEPVGEEMVE
ncbi:hypothetical protein ACFSR7_06860 [Cohnella sp. GCM10020058]|uniref:AbrB/MazE/SpoVT family DNA-binding domain-containing protein n=1 Tax=Cohnella sp. GCM10020058 TaxID=3317330 RepID=UPI003635B9CA